jgi:hypothetical protein
MSAHRLFTLTLTCVLLAAATTYAEYDWYDEREGSRREPDEDRDEDEDEDYAYPSYDDKHAADEGFALGLRLAYAHPLGELVKGGDLEDFVRGVVKGQLDLDYGLSPSSAIGLYLAVGGGLLPDSLKSTCDQGGADCKLLSIESGMAVTYRILPDALVDPWFSANLGLEWLRNAIDSSLGGGSTSFLGIAFGPSVGADVQLGGFAFGPYFSPQFGYFMRGKVKNDFAILEGFNGSAKIDDRAIHYWLNFGLRGRYQF